MLGVSGVTLEFPRATRSCVHVHVNGKPDSLHILRGWGGGGALSPLSANVEVIEVICFSYVTQDALLWTANANACWR